MFALEACLSDLHLSSYCVLPCELLHDLKGYLASVLRMLPSILPSSALNGCVCEYLDTLWNKPNLCGSDLREALVDVALIFPYHPAQGPIFNNINCLVQVSKIPYSLDSDRNPKKCLQFYKCAYKVHELLCTVWRSTHLTVLSCTTSSWADAAWSCVQQVHQHREWGKDLQKCWVCS